MDRQTLFGRWLIRADDFKRLGVLVPGDRLIAEFLADLEAVFVQEKYELLTLDEAAALSGYSADHLGRLVRGGRIPNYGQRNRPRIRAGDLPRKADALRRQASGEILSDSSRRQIARSVVNSETGRHDG